MNLHVADSADEARRLSRDGSFSIVRKNVSRAARRSF